MKYYQNKDKHKSKYEYKSEHEYLDEDKCKHVNYKVIFSKRKTIELQVKKSLEIIVRAPYGVTHDDIHSFVIKHKSWIEKSIDKFKDCENNRYSNNIDKMTEEEHLLLRQQAVDILPQKVEHFSNVMKLYPTGLKITSAKTRWGSCNSKNSLCFSYRLMAMPERFIDYVVVHELAHIKEKNHSKKFYDIVKLYVPDYKEVISSVK